MDERKVFIVGCGPSPDIGLLDFIKKSKSYEVNLCQNIMQKKYDELLNNGRVIVGVDLARGKDKTVQYGISTANMLMLKKDISEKLKRKYDKTDWRCALLDGRVA